MRRIRRFLFLIGLLVVLIVAILAISLGGALFFTQAVAETGDAFMSAVKAGDFAEAYALVDQELQEELGSPESFGMLISAHQVQPVSWAYYSRRTLGSLGELKGNITLGNGLEQQPLRLSLRQQDGQWRVIGFLFADLARGEFP